MKYQNFNDDNAADRKFYLDGFAADRKFYLDSFAANRKFYLRVCASDRKFYKTRSAFKRKFSFCLKKEKRRKPKQETVGAIVATHPPASCPPFGRKLQVKAFPAFGQMQGCADFMRLWRNFMPRQFSSWTGFTRRE